MPEIPFRAFDGLLKQHAHDCLSEAEKTFFDTLFPAFQGTSDAQNNFERLHTQFGSVWQALSPLVSFVPGERRQRRYAGSNLPRNRYYTVASDQSGDDCQTLAHELRAYRDPVDTGMVEVIDLADGCNLQIGARQVHLHPEPAIAVLIHEPGRLPQSCSALRFERLPGLHGGDLLLYRFRYHVSRQTISNCIDLRFPEVRQWFFETFRNLAKSSDTIQAPFVDPREPTTALSRFHFENGRAPVPDSFWAMLPTLVNPDLGGGNVADTGSTLTVIGHWMQNHGVGALVYPSARADAGVMFESGRLKGFRGWNLVDYQNAPAFPNVHVLTIVLSSWAWRSLPRGVGLKLAEASSLFSGSFMLDGVVDYWAQDYLTQLKALDIARELHGPAVRDSSPEQFAPRVFRISGLCMRWFRLALCRRPAEEVDRAVLELQGLALPCRLYPITGRVLELWADVKEKPCRPDEIVDASLGTADRVVGYFGRQCPGTDLDHLAQAGCDIELLLVWLSARSAGQQMDLSNLDMKDCLAAMAMAARNRWLPDGLVAEMAVFRERAADGLRRTSSPLDELIRQGNALEERVHHHLRTSAPQ
jgi:hypothetical protein